MLYLFISHKSKSHSSPALVHARYIRFSYINKKHCLFLERSDKLKQTKLTGRNIVLSDPAMT